MQASTRGEQSRRGIANPRGGAKMGGVLVLHKRCAPLPYTWSLSPDFLDCLAIRAANLASLSSSLLTDVDSVSVVLAEVIATLTPLQLVRHLAVRGRLDPGAEVHAPTVTLADQMAPFPQLFEVG